MLAEDKNGFTKWVRTNRGTPTSILIVMNGDAFYRGNQTYRSDIRWLWKAFNSDDIDIRVGKDGYMTMLVTNEASIYNPPPQLKIVKGSFEDAELMWKWIKFVCHHSWWKQKQGQIRKFIDGLDQPLALAKVSEALIELEG